MWSDMDTVFSGLLLAIPNFLLSTFCLISFSLGLYRYIYTLERQRQLREKSPSAFNVVKEVSELDVINDLSSISANNSFIDNNVLIDSKVQDHLKTILNLSSSNVETILWIDTPIQGILLRTSLIYLGVLSGLSIVLGFLFVAISLTLVDKREERWSICAMGFVAGALPFLISLSYLFAMFCRKTTFVLTTQRIIFMRTTNVLGSVFLDTKEFWIKKKNMTVKKVLKLHKRWGEYGNLYFKEAKKFEEKLSLEWKTSNTSQSMLWIGFENIYNVKKLSKTFENLLV